MGYTVYRPDPFEQFYVAWCSIAESPVCWGSREEVLEFMLWLDHEKEEYARPRWETALGHADYSGSSCRRSSADYDLIEFFEQRGILRVSDLKEFCESYDPDSQRFDLSFLTPFEDLDEVKGYLDGPPQESLAREDDLKGTSGS